MMKSTIAAPFVLVLAASGRAWSAGDALPFTEEAAARGVVYVPNQNRHFGDSIAFADLDRDGDPDIIAVGRLDGLVGIFENDGTGHFIDRSLTCGIPLLPLCSGATAVDYDRDGDLDIHISRHDLPDALLRQDAPFSFTDVAQVAGVDDTANGYGCAWADVDLDGWLDLYVSNRGPANRLFRNLGSDGTSPVRFVDIAVEAGVDRGDDPTFQASFFDADLDGDPDLYLANDHGLGCTPYQNHLFENVGGTFVEITDNVTSACVHAMSIAIGDFDGNMRQDLYCTNGPDGHALMMCMGDGVWVHAAEKSGTAAYQIGWGAVFFDFDNDGRQDLYVCHVFSPNRLYRHDGEWPATDVSEAMGVQGPYRAYSPAVADIDGDGDLDLIVSPRHEPVALFINHEGERRGHARFRVMTPTHDGESIGARVDLRTGDTWQTREIVAGSNFKSQNELVAHFGVGAATMLDEVVVTWPGGAARTLTNYPAGHQWTAVPESWLGDGDLDGDRDLTDFLAMAACATGDAPGSLAPGCEAFDLEGDGDVDAADLELMLPFYSGVLEDCNGNGIIDLIEIIDGTAIDADGNGVIDGCGQVVPGDLNGDAIVDAADLLILISAWGQPGSAADLDGDGVVEVDDLVLLLGSWG